jgi:DNA transformation protein
VVASPGYLEFLRDALSPLGRVAPRRMFGSTGLFCDGVMFALVSDDTLYFRVDDESRETFAEAASHPPLSYRKGGRSIDLAYWRAPDRLFDETDDLVAWARAALAAAHRVASSRSPPGRP